MSQPTTIQLKDFCELFDFEDRQVRFVLEQGFVPQGVAKHPSTGNRREFGPAHAFWLAIVVLLRKNGLKTPVAVKIADITTEGVRIRAQNLNWDANFLPLYGWFETDHAYFLDVADLKFIRLLTDANPSHEGLYEFGWRRVRGRSHIRRGLAPIVILRLDLSQIARVLSKVEGWECPHRHTPAAE